LQAKLQIHIITEQKVFNLYRKFNLHKTQNTKNIRWKPKIVRTADYSSAYVSKMAVLIIFPVILQTAPSSFSNVTALHKKAPQPKKCHAAAQIFSGLWAEPSFCETPV